MDDDDWDEMVRATVGLAYEDEYDDTLEMYSESQVKVEQANMEDDGGAEDTDEVQYEGKLSQQEKEALGGNKKGGKRDDSRVHQGSQGNWSRNSKDPRSAHHKQKYKQKDYDQKNENERSKTEYISKDTQDYGEGSQFKTSKQSDKSKISNEKNESQVKGKGSKKYEPKPQEKEKAEESSKNTHDYDESYNDNYDEDDSQDTYNSRGGSYGRRGGQGGGRRGDRGGRRRGGDRGGRGRGGAKVEYIAKS